MKINDVAVGCDKTKWRFMADIAQEVFGYSSRCASTFNSQDFKFVHSQLFISDMPIANAYFSRL